eukprot:TRINITY_DN6843_c0_g1_i8.p1 TRINITY_DN6843_c0_g1~~TRINITY_DN6843_c0_g1_i8.p1  ORF type:complete len:175 (-),score=42.49 TRINITY_DN6843_c0_g1_i8:134-658(-)
MQCQWLFTVISVASIAVQVRSECTEEQLNKAQMMFKDCMDEKKVLLLQTDVSEDEAHAFICKGLKDLSTGCKEPVTQFAVCRGREFVDNLVAIHLNAMAEILAPFYLSVNLTSCPVFHTPVPTVVHVHHTDHISTQPQPEDQPEYQPVTGRATHVQTSITVWLIVALLKMRLAL